MIAKKPRKTEEAFLRGARGSNGSSAAAGIGRASSNRPRIPDDVYQQLKDLAWGRRISANALILEMLLEGIAKRQKGKG